MSSTLEKLTSSKRDDHETPEWLFDYLDKIFHFDMDVCASQENAKCKRFLTKSNDFLGSDLLMYCPLNCFWMNPPYGKPEHPCKPNCKKKKCIERGHCISEYIPGKIDFVRHAHEQSKTVPGVMLLKNDPTTEWGKYFWKAEYVLFLNKRIRFLIDGKEQTGAPHSSVVCIFGRGLSKKEIEYLSAIGKVKGF